VILDLDTSDHKGVYSEFVVNIPKEMPDYTEDPAIAWVKFKKIEADGLLSLDLDKKSDPYICFYGLRCLPLDNSFSTPVKQNTLSPVWNEESLPTLPLHASNKEYLEKEHIIMVIKDKDSLSKDDLMGTALLPIKEILEKKKSFEWTADCIRHGHRSAGRIKVIVETEMALSHQENAPHSKWCCWPKKFVTHDESFQLIADDQPRP